MREAAKVAGIARQTHYDWMKEPEYERRFIAAYNTGTQALEDEALERVREGKSDTMLIFLMKGAMPEKYRERWDGHISGAGGGPIETKDVTAREQVESRITGILARVGTQADSGRTDGAPTGEPAP